MYSTQQQAADAAEIQRNAYNAAFYELGFGWHWDTPTYQAIACQSDECLRLRAYLEQHQPHLLKAYDPEFLVEAILTMKERCFDSMTAEGCRGAAFIDWAEIQQGQVGV